MRKFLFYLSIIVLLIIPTSCSRLRAGKPPMSNLPSPLAINAQPMRGVWVTTVYGIDWPHNPKNSTFDPERQKRQFTDMLDRLKALGINAVFVQVQPTADAFYPSKCAPWSQWLTGTQGKYPGYNPLKFMIEETHKRGMQFHAWFNPYRVSVQGDISKLVEGHPARRHPEWIIKHQGKLYYDPGIPQVRKHIIYRIIEVVAKYNIDGVHLDDYFYQYGEDKEPFNDNATYLKYNKGFHNKADWRRNNVNKFVQTLNKRIKEVKPEVKFGISPFGIWRNVSDDSTGSMTKDSGSSYDGLYADSRAWIKNGWVDYIVPQIYWPIGDKNTPYDTLVKWWVKEIAGTGVELYIGHAPYKLENEKDPAWDSANELIKQLEFNKKFDVVKGSLFYSATSLMKNTKQVAHVLQQYYVKKVNANALPSGH